MDTNYQKSKIMDFAKKPKQQTWITEKSKIELVQSVKYLGVIFYDGGSWKSHGKYIKQVASKST